MKLSTGSASLDNRIPTDDLYGEDEYKGVVQHARLNLEAAYLPMALNPFRVDATRGSLPTG